MCILNKRHKNKKKVVEQVDFTNKEVEEDDKEEEGAERARGKCNTFLLFCFVSSFVVVVEKQPSAFCTLSLARSLTSCSSLCLSRFPVAAGRWYRSRRRRRGHPAPSRSLSLSYFLACLSFSRAHAKNVSVFVCLLCLALFVLLNLYLYFIFTKIYTNRLRIVINFN